MGIVEEVDVDVRFRTGTVCLLMWLNVGLEFGPRLLSTVTALGLPLRGSWQGLKVTRQAGVGRTDPVTRFCITVHVQVSSAVRTVPTFDGEASTTLSTTISLISRAGDGKPGLKVLRNLRDT